MSTGVPFFQCVHEKHGYCRSCNSTDFTVPGNSDESSQKLINEIIQEHQVVPQELTHSNVDVFYSIVRATEAYFPDHKVRLGNRTVTVLLLGSTVISLCGENKVIVCGKNTPPCEHKLYRSSFLHDLEKIYPFQRRIDYFKTTRWLLACAFLGFSHKYFNGNEFKVFLYTIRNKSLIGFTIGGEYSNRLPYDQGYSYGSYIGEAMFSSLYIGMQDFTNRCFFDFAINGENLYSDKVVKFLAEIYEGFGGLPDEPQFQNPRMDAFLCAELEKHTPGEGKWEDTVVPHYISMYDRSLLTQIFPNIRLWSKSKGDTLVIVGGSSTKKIWVDDEDIKKMKVLVVKKVSENSFQMTIDGELITTKMYDFSKYVRKFFAFDQQYQHAALTNHSTDQKILYMKRHPMTDKALESIKDVFEGYGYFVHYGTGDFGTVAFSKTDPKTIFNFGYFNEEGTLHGTDFVTISVQEFKNGEPLFCIGYRRSGFVSAYKNLTATDVRKHSEKFFLGKDK